MVRARLDRCKSKRTGATTVEFAVTCSFAFFFFFASLEFSRVSMYRHTVENALYEGARAGIVPGASADKVRDKTRELLAIAGISDATIDVTPAVLTKDTPRVNVRVRMRLDRGLYAPAFYFLGKTLDRSFEMAREGVR
ncbi:TadE/TadG family type IV pilus assembly protein [Pirellulaceae bacterium SH467]